MKSEKLIITLLVALLAVNSVGMVMTVMEEKEQTRIALKTAEIVSLQSDLEAYTKIIELGAKDYKINMDYFIASHAEDTIERISEIYTELQIEGENGYRINHAYHYEGVVADLGE